jgi:hypothetical protein
MTDLTLEEFREVEPGQELAARLRRDAFLIWGPKINATLSLSKSEAKRRSKLSILAGWFLRLSFRAS